MSETAQGPLSRLAALHKSETAKRSTGGGVNYDGPAFLQANDDDLAALGIYIAGHSKRKDYGDVEELTGCPYSQDHEDGAFRFQLPSGYVDVRCHHNRCKGKSLKDHPDLFPKSHEVKRAGETSGLGRLTAGGKHRRTDDAVTSTGDEAPSEWEPPLPLDPLYGPPFPVDALPGILREMVEAVAEETQTPPDLAACVALGVLSAAAGGKYVAHVTVSSHTEPLHLMLAPTAGPGNRKSAVFQRLTPPVRTFEQERNQEEAAQLQEWESRERTLKGQMTAAEKGETRKRKDGPITDSEAVRMAAVEAYRLHLETRPVLTEIYSDDITPEATKERLIEQRGAFAIMSAESAFLSIVAGRYSAGGRREPNLDVILNGHAGEEIKVTRKGKPTERTERACLTLCLMLQPHVFETLGDVDGFADRGAAARILPAFPADRIGHRRIETAPVPESTLSAWETMVTEVLEVKRTGTPAVLHLDSEATNLYRVYFYATEPTIKSEGRRMGEWNGKLVGAVLRIAGLLHIAEYPRPESRPIEGETFRRAIDIGTYFQHHARIMFRMMNRSGQSDAASILDVLRTAETVQTPEGDYITFRDVWRRVQNRSGFERADLSAALDVLEEAGWIRREKQTGPKGGRPSEYIWLHPETQCQNRQKPDSGTVTGGSVTFGTQNPETSEPGNLTRIRHRDPEPAPLDPTGTDDEWSMPL